MIFHAPAAFFCRDMLVIRRYYRQHIIPARRHTREHMARAKMRHAMLLSMADAALRDARFRDIIIDARRHDILPIFSFTPLRFTPCRRCYYC